MRFLSKPENRDENNENWGELMYLPDNHGELMSP
jgi:hypothetical protein